MTERQVKITLVRSPIGYTVRQKATVRSLGLRRMHQSVIHPDRPEIRGMANAIEHLVRVEELSATETTGGASE